MHDRNIVCILEGWVVQQSTITTLILPNLWWLAGYGCRRWNIPPHLRQQITPIKPKEYSLQSLLYRHLLLHLYTKQNLAINNRITMEKEAKAIAILLPPPPCTPPLCQRLSEVYKSYLPPPICFIEWCENFVKDPCLQDYLWCFFSLANFF